jgi:hypothetical protein
MWALVMITAIGAWSQEPTPQAAQDAFEERATASPDSDLITEIERKELEAFSTPGARFETWEEFVAWWTTPRPFKKERVVRIDENYAYPHVVSATKMLIEYLAAGRAAGGPELAALQDLGTA